MVEASSAVSYCDLSDRAAKHMSGALFLMEHLVHFAEVDQNRSTRKVFSPGMVVI